MNPEPSNLAANPVPPTPPALASVSGSAALLEIIRVCEEYQNADTEGMALETQCDDGYRCSMKVITIASAALEELEARQNAPDQVSGATNQKLI